MDLFEPREIAQQLCERWKQHPLFNTCHQPPPAPASLAEVLKVAYVASMQREEGRPLKFGIMLRKSNEPDEPEFCIARFEQPRPLGYREICHLAAATGQSSCFLAVELSDSGSSIWGTIDVGSAWALLQNAEKTSGMILPDHLIIVATAPGTLKIKFSEFSLYVVEHGIPARAKATCNVLKHGPVHEFLRRPMRRVLEEAFHDRTDLLNNDHFFLSYGKEYLRFLARTLRDAEALGHGGTLIVIPEDQRNLAINLMSIKYPISCFSFWPDLVRYVRLIFDSIEFWKQIDGMPEIDALLFSRWRTFLQDEEKLSQKLIDRSRFLARLTQVDGAVVITERLDLLGFGAVIKDSPTSRPTARYCVGELGEESIPLDPESFGTRHRSAINLCGQTNCLAFVLSQDGGVKAMIRRDDDVLLWPSLRLDHASWLVTSEDIIPELKQRFLNRESYLIR
jgi:hypothetical protein